MSAMNSADSIKAVDEAIRSRHSVRRFLPTAVSQTLVEELLELASRAPSGTNVQPWKVYVLTGAPKDALSEAILAKHEQGKKEGREFDYYPKEWKDPWLSRRRKIGLGLYGLLGIGKDDKEAMKKQAGRNYLFFDAPVGLIITMDRSMGIGMFVDCGMFLGNLMIAARARGLDTCPQLSFADYPKTVQEQLALPDHEQIVCGMSLGYGDPTAPENALVTEREPVKNFASFRGFS